MPCGILIMSNKKYNNQSDIAEITNQFLQDILENLKNSQEYADAEMAENLIFRLTKWCSETDLEAVLKSYSEVKVFHDFLTTSWNLLHKPSQVSIINILENLNSLENKLLDNNENLEKAYLARKIGDNFKRDTTKTKKRLLIVESDQLVLNHTSSQFEMNGFEVSQYQTFDNFDKTVQVCHPDIIIVDLQLIDERWVEYLRFISSKSSSFQIALICISSIDTFKSRLLSVRCGTSSYILRPVNFFELLDIVNNLFLPINKDPFRIMVVDQDQETLDYIQHHLESSGCLVSTMQSGKEAIDSLYDFTPDMLLAGWFLSDCSGVELSSVTRQLRNFINISVVFLYDQSEIPHTLKSGRVDSDIYITKPIDKEKLVETVYKQSARARSIRSVMFEDNLTGLFNRMAIRQAIERELSRAKRNNENLTMAIIDIDHFKSVNDNHGHMIGDRVLKTFADFLGGSFRRADIIGRFGGEEFVVIMPNTLISVAEVVINKVRHNFSQVVHDSGTAKFNVTFSCGLADFPKYSGFNQLFDHADMALYHAKGKGRNVVVVMD